MVPIDIPISITMGQAFAYVARNSLKDEPNYVGNHFLVLNNWYFSVIQIPVALFLLSAWPGWETMYLWKWIEEPLFNPLVALFYFLFLIAMIVLGNAGFILAHRLYRSDKEPLARNFLILSILITISSTFFDIEAPIHIGTYDEYHSGKAISITEVMHGETDKNHDVDGTSMEQARQFWFSWLFIVIYLVGGTVLMFVKFFRSNKQYRRKKP